MYKDMTLSGGGASTYSHGPPLALYDLIGQKEAPVPYAYSCDMSIVGEEDEREDDTVPSYHTVVSPPPPIGGASDGSGRDDDDLDLDNSHHGPETQDEETPRQSGGFERSHQPGRGQRTGPDTDAARPRITQRETFPQTPTKRPNWQTIRYQTMPGRAHRAQLDAWVGGWSAAVGELGDETYCACADSTAAAAGDARRSSPRPTMSRNGKYLVEKISSELVGTRRSSGTSHREVVVDNRGRQTEEEEEEEDATVPPARLSIPVASVCHNCCHLPSPPVAPDDEFVFPPAGGAARVALACKLAWRRIVGRASGRQGPAASPRPVVADALPVSQGGGGRRGYDNKEEYDEEDYDNDDEEVDVDKLSLSSRGSRTRGVDIAERQARLRRAQRLLRKAAGGTTREAG